MPYFDDFDYILYEPSPRRKKYTFQRNERLRKRWSVLLSVSALEDVWESDSSPANHHRHHNSSSPLGGGHKPSFKGTKLARRARSFKDDFLGKISQMRSPGSTMVGSLPRNQGSKHHNSTKRRHIMDSPEAQIYGVGTKGPLQELEGMWKQTQIALKHLRDVVSKQKLEMLPGNGTIVLDTVWAINLTIKSSVPIEKCSSVSDATQRVYHTVARLIKLCDDALIDSESNELKNENVNEIVAQVEDAVKNLIELARDRISTDQSQNHKSLHNCNLETSQRNSLPDIPLTDREMQILEQKSHQPPVRGSHSTESILREPSPPPKPPLPASLRTKFELGHCVTPPPLPPKKKNHMRINNLVDDDFRGNSSPICNSLERVSMRSKSPEDSISLLSEETGSIDSMLNQSSKEEDEITALMDYDKDGEILDNHTSDIFGIGSNNSWEESSLSSGISNNNLDLHTSVNDYHRLSNTDSGIVSIRSSSYSKRSSQQSSMSAQYCSVRQANESHHNENHSLRNFTHEGNVSATSISRVVVSNSSHSIVSRENLELLEDDMPPAIPQKTKRKTENRQPSPYDNVPEENSLCEAVQGELLVTCHHHQSHHSHNHSLNLSSISSSSVNSGSTFDEVDSKPPPLPPKKKHIMAYMEMFGNCSHTNDQDFMRHSVHIAQAQWGQPALGGMSTAQSCSFSHTTMSHTTRNSSPTDMHSRLALPAQAHNQRVPSPLHSPNTTSISSSSSTSSVVPPALPPKQKTRKSSFKSPPSSPTGTLLKEPKISSHPSSPNPLSLPDLLEHTVAADVQKSRPDDDVKCSKRVEVDLIEEVKVDGYLVWKKPDEDGPDLRGGTVDALIIQATKATKNGVFAYQEAFLTTYRTFIQPYELICKLIRRYNHFYNQTEKKPRSREAFALIVRVVSDLTALDLDDTLQHQLMNFVQQLISCGELILAKALRVKHLERHAAKEYALRYSNIPGHTLSLTARNLTLLEFKTEQIAEQMTLLDAELFMKIEIPEVLLWAQEQKEEKSPNLTRFTEHFNKMSYWARTKILTGETKEVREKYFMKFIKIMKHLRKINNYNSYLALLSALDSGPIRRLEWPKQYQESVKEFCTLIDSSSSFKAYRMALAETQPPCIPYIGLVLQDLTFVHEGNDHILSDVPGMINFSKRWQQFNIVENMKKFKKETYSFKKNEKIIQFFQNFDDFIGEDPMWKLSENIKPRGGKKTMS